MIVDTSALIAILLDEPEARAFVRAIRAAARPRISAAAFVEAVEVYKVRAQLPSPVEALDEDLALLGLTIEPVTAEQAHLAAEARLRFGKGRHPARLNFGDSFAYALAKSTGEPLLFKGDDFIHTDIERAAV